MFARSTGSNGTPSPEIDLPVIETERLSLRPYRDSDAEAPGLAEPFERVNRDFVGTGPGQLIRIVHEEVAARREAIWALEHQASSEVIGLVGLNHFSPVLKHSGADLAKNRISQAEVFYSLRQSYEGQGLAREAVSGLLTYGFLKLGIMEFKAAVDDRNIDSLRLLARLGFSQAGVELRNTHGFAVADLPTYRLGFSDFAQANGSHFDAVRWPS